MVAFSTSNVFTELSPNPEIKEIIIETPMTMVNSDTVTVILVDHGISNSGFLSVNGFVQTTSNSIVVIEQPTTSVSAGVLTITAPTGVNKNKIRIYRIVGKSN